MPLVVRGHVGLVLGGFTEQHRSGNVQLTMSILAVRLRLVVRRTHLLHFTVRTCEGDPESTADT